MRQFINLSSRVINKLHIIQIIKEPSKYYIHITERDFTGHIFFSSGSMSSYNNIIEICEKDNKLDYDTITNEIKKIN
jgi:hypothetical protein